MKKLLKISLVMVVLWIMMIGNVYGITLIPNFSKVQVERGKEFDVDFSIENVSISDMQSDTGIVTMTATLDYDKDNLELIKLEGQNGWSTPGKGSFNEEKGKLVITNDAIKNGVVLRLRFKLNDNASKNPEISLNNITFADGDVDAMLKLASEKTVVTIKETNGGGSGTQTGHGSQGETGSQTGSGNQEATGSQTGTDNQGSNVDKTIITNKELPKTGEPSYVGVMVSGTIILAIAVFTKK